MESIRGVFYAGQLTMAIHLDGKIYDCVFLHTKKLNWHQT